MHKYRLLIGVKVWDADREVSMCEFGSKKYKVYKWEKSRLQMIVSCSQYNVCILL
jgi:hypothetical protein